MNKNLIEAKRLNDLIEKSDAANERRKVKRNRLVWEVWKDGVSQREIAKAVGVTQQAISLWVKTHEMSLVQPGLSATEAEAAVRNRPTGPARTEQMREELAPRGQRIVLPEERHAPLKEQSQFEYELEFENSINRIPTIVRELIRRVSARPLESPEKHLHAIEVAKDSLEQLRDIIAGLTIDELTALLEEQ